MKRFIACLAAVTLAFSVTGCWRGKEEKGATLTVDLDQSYTAEQVIINGKSTEISPVCATDKGVFLYYSAGRNYQTGGKYVLVFYDAATGEYKEIEPVHGYTCNDMYAMSGGRVAILYSRSWQKKDWEYEEDYYMDIYDSNMQYLETRTIPEVLGDNDLQYCQAQFNGKGEFLYVQWMGDHFSIIVLDEQMQEKDIINVDYYTELVIGEDGEAYLFDSTGLVRVDTEQGRLVPIKLEGVVPDWMQNPIAGTCGYTMYISSQDGIYGVKVDGTQGTSEKVVDFVNSDFLDVSPYGVVSVPDGGFFWSAGDDHAPGLWLAHPRTEEEKENCQLISLAGIDFDDSLKEAVCNYNRSQSDYHIVMVDYSNDPRWRVGLTEEDMYDYNKTQDAKEAVFWQDLLDGVVPDMLCTDKLPFQQLAGKGMFVDLSEYLEKDERFHPDDYVMNFYDSMKYKGELLTMAFSFQIETVAGRTSAVGDKTALSPDEYLAMLNSRPEDTHAMRNTLQEFYVDYFLKNLQSSFMDTETSTCSFDSPAFAALLEIGKEIPTSYTGYDGREMRDGTTLLMNDKLGNPIRYHELTAGFFGYDEITLVGYPVTGEGNGGIFRAPYTVSINAQSKYKEQIWEIFMTLLNEENQKRIDLANVQSFPVLRSALEEDIHAATLGMFRTTYADFGEVNTGNATEEEMEKLMDYIENIRMFLYTDPQIGTIMEEEAEKFFAGDQTAEEAAKMIQSRASLYISEQY